MAVRNPQVLAELNGADHAAMLGARLATDALIDVADDPFSSLQRAAALRRRFTELLFERKHCGRIPYGGKGSRYSVHDLPHMLMNIMRRDVEPADRRNFRGTSKWPPSTSRELARTDYSKMTKLLGSYQECCQPWRECRSR